MSPHIYGRDYKHGERVRFRKDDAMGTIVRAFRGRMPAGTTYVVRLDKPDEDGPVRCAGSGEFRTEEER